MLGNASCYPLVRESLEGDAEALIDGLRAEGFVRPGVAIDADELLAYVLPFIVVVGNIVMPIAIALGWVPEFSR